MTRIMIVEGELLISEELTAIIKLYDRVLIEIIGSRFLGRKNEYFSYIGIPIMYNS